MKLVQCSGVSKRFGGTQALDRITLTLESGEPIALIGPNGAGKTTLLSVLCGYIRVSDGAVTVLGHAPGSQALNGQLSALPQDAQLDPRLSVGRQLRFFARLQGMNASQARRDVERVLDTVDLRASVDTKPADLSHGMRKRIAIAQALLGSPKLVLLDEPTAGIDPPNAKMIRDLIREQSGDTTFVVSSHNLDELERLCGSVVYLEHGKLVSVGQVADDEENNLLTLRLRNVPASEFIPEASALPGIRQVSQTAQGDFHVQTDDNMLASLQLLQLLVEKGWRYRQIASGKTLEERLYGDRGSSQAPDSFRQLHLP